MGRLWHVHTCIRMYKAIFDVIWYDTTNCWNHSMALDPGFSKHPFLMQALLQADSHIRILQGQACWTLDLNTANASLCDEDCKYFLDIGSQWIKVIWGTGKAASAIFTGHNAHPWYLKEKPSGSQLKGRVFTAVTVAGLDSNRGNLPFSRSCWPPSWLMCWLEWNLS